MYFCPTVPINHYKMFSRTDLYCTEKSFLRGSTLYCDHILSLRKPVILQDSEDQDFVSTIKMAEEIRCPFVVLPFSEKDDEGTRRGYKSGMAELRALYGNVGKSTEYMKPRTVAVVQGDTWKAFWSCWKEAISIGADLIGIPDNIDFNAPGKVVSFNSDQFSLSWQRSMLRARLMTYLVEEVIESGLLNDQVVKSFRHHLMGMSSPVEIAFYRNLGIFVYSMETQLPFVAAVEDYSFVKDSSKYFGPLDECPMWPIKKFIELKEVSSSVKARFQENIKAMLFLYRTGKQLVRRA